MGEVGIRQIKNQLNYCWNNPYPASINKTDGAYSGKEALKLINNEGYGFVFTDVKMPEMNGVELFREIKKVRPKIKVLLMTAYTSQEVIQEALAEGAIDCLAKPLDIEKLLNIISSAK